MTRSACVMGWPAKHSNSPLIHRYWLRTYGIDGEYRVEEIPPADFAAFVRDLAGHGYVGGNVTMPHKVAALELARADARARAVGAANTLWLDDDGVLHATNTDGEGFFDNLDIEAPGWTADLSHAVVLGAGGAARAIVHGLRERGAAAIHVVNRSQERAEGLRADFGPAIHPAPWDRLERLLPDATLIVNTTSLGMKGQPDRDWDLSSAREDAVVADIVYVPLETGLLSAARRRGLRTADGLGMLLHQAVTGFHRWFGVRPEVTDEQRRLVLDAIAERT